MRHPQLFNIAQALKIGVCYQIKNQLGWYGNKPVNRVVYYFLFIQSGYKYAKVLNYDKTSTFYLLIYVNGLYIFTTKYTNLQL